MHDKRKYAEHLTILREFLLKSAGLSVLEFPSEFDDTSEFAKMGPQPPDNWVLKALAETIDVALEAFGDIQRTLACRWMTRHSHGAPAVTGSKAIRHPSNERRFNTYANSNPELSKWDFYRRR